MTSERQALAAGERSGSGGDVSARQRSGEGAPQQLRRSTSSRLERLPSAFLERIPEHAAALEAPLTAQDLLPGALKIPVAPQFAPTAHMEHSHELCPLKT